MEATFVRKSAVYTLVWTMLVPCVVRAYGQESAPSKLPLPELRARASAGDPAAENALGDRYDNGDGVARDLSQSFAWYSKAAAHGSADGEFNLAFAYQTGRGVNVDVPRAVQEYTKAANQGQVPSMIKLAILYDSGNGIPADKLLAFQWFERAARAGSTTGMNDLAFAYESGAGTPVNFAAAVEWYTKAAQAGNSVSAVNLGNLYRFGKGVTKDLAAAARWYKYASDKNYVEGQFLYAFFLHNGYGVPADQASAAALYERAAQKGHAMAQANLGYDYQYGYGVPQDLTKALFWYEKAASQGVESARKAVAELRAAPTYNTSATVSSLEAEALGQLKRGDMSANTAVSAAGGGPASASTRQLRIEELNNQIADAERDALDNDHLAEQADELTKQAQATATSGGGFGAILGVLGSGASAGKAQQYRNQAQSARTRAQNLRNELAGLGAEQPEEQTHSTLADIAVQHAQTGPDLIQTALNSNLNNIQTSANHNAELRAQQQSTPISSSSEGGSSTIGKCPNGKYVDTANHCDCRRYSASIYGCTSGNFASGTAQGNAATSRVAQLSTAEPDAASRQGSSGSTSAYASTASSSVNRHPGTGIAPPPSCVDLGPEPGLSCVPLSDWQQIQLAPENIMPPTTRPTGHVQVFYIVNSDIPAGIGVHWCPKSGHISTGYYSAPGVFNPEQDDCKIGYHVRVTWPAVDDTTTSICPASGWIMHQTGDVALGQKCIPGQPVDGTSSGSGNSLTPGDGTASGGSSSSSSGSGSASGRPIVPGLNNCVSLQYKNEQPQFVNQCSERAIIRFFLEGDTRALTEYADPGAFDNTLLYGKRVSSFYACPFPGEVLDPNGKPLSQASAKYECVKY